MLREGNCIFRVKVRASNNGAQRFYELLGFKVESIRKKFYGNPDEDALMMMRRL